ncbi:MAG: 50S ribosomal protein L10 [Patescibacteria group bacterium]
MATQKKIDTVTLLTDKISRAKAMVFVDYRGLKHKQMEELRKNLKKVEAEFTVAKNRLMKRALDSAKKGLNPVETGFLSDTTATLFSYADEITPLKELLKYFKVAGAGIPKAGFLGETVLNESDITKLAGLPSRRMLLTILVVQLNAPIQGLHRALSWNINTLVWGLNAIKEKKTA